MQVMSNKFDFLGFGHMGLQPFKVWEGGLIFMKSYDYEDSSRKILIV